LIFQFIFKLFQALLDHFLDTGKVLIIDGFSRFHDNDIGIGEMDGSPSRFTQLLFQAGFQSLPGLDDWFELFCQCFVEAQFHRITALVQLGKILISASFDFRYSSIDASCLFPLGFGDFFFQLLEGFLASIFIDIGHHILCKIENAIQVAPGNIQ